MNNLLNIARIISSNDEQVISKVEQCVIDYKKFFTDNPDIYEYYDLDPDDKDQIQWLGLKNILESNGYVCERDWKDEKADFMYFVQNLKNTRKYHLSIEQEWLSEDGSIDLWCPIIDEHWKSSNCCLACIDIDSDSYVLFACEINDLNTLKRIAGEIGHKIDHAKCC